MGWLPYRPLALWGLINDPPVHNVIIRGVRTFYDEARARCDCSEIQSSKVGRRSAAGMSQKNQAACSHDGVADGDRSGYERCLTGGFITSSRKIQPAVEVNVGIRGERSDCGCIASVSNGGRADDCFVYICIRFCICSKS